jgi:hypothetical protein
MPGLALWHAVDLQTLFLGSRIRQSLPNLGYTRHDLDQVNIGASSSLLIATNLAVLHAGEVLDRT